MGFLPIPDISERILETEALRSSYLSS